MSECIGNSFIVNSEIRTTDVFEDYPANEGKSIYEVIRIISGVPLFLEHHLERFINSSALIGEELLLNREEIKTEIAQLLEANKLYDGNVKIVFSYTAKRNYSFFYFIKHSYPSEEQYENGVDTVLFHGERTNPNAKVINKDFREAVDRIINTSNAYEAILVDNNGYITEGSKSNIFMVRGNEVLTSPLEAVLPGVTRGAIIQLLKELNINVKEAKVSFREIGKLDALFISGTSPKVLPVRKVDDYIYDSSDNEIVRILMKEYDKKIQSYIENYK